MRHAFRNALIPLATLVAFDIGGLIGGAVVTERVFAFTGMGDLFVHSLVPIPDPNPVMGTFLVIGDLPVEILPAGEHRIRVVGIRVIDGVTVDANGEVVLPDEVLAEIRRFDLGTDATVRVVGPNPDGGTHVALRIVPLDPTPPWWTLWFVFGAWLAGSIMRRQGRITTIRHRSIAAVAMLASALPAVILGWRATTTEVVWWGIGLTVLALVLAAVIAPRRVDEQQPPEVPVPVSV
jgi:hypothetical protein